MKARLFQAKGRAHAKSSGKKGRGGGVSEKQQEGLGATLESTGEAGFVQHHNPSRALGQAGKAGKGWILQEPRGQKREPMLSTHQGKPRKGFKPRSDRLVRVLQAIEQFCPEK